MTAENFTDSVGQVATGVWRGPNGEKFIGVLCGVLNDLLAEAASTAWQASSLYPLTPRAEDYKTPLDAIERMGRDALILRYPGENHYTSLRPRVRAKWTYWTGNIKDALVADLAAAGYPGAEIFVPNDFTPRPPPDTYWSRFWVFFPFGTHPVTTTFSLATVGTAVVGTDRVGALFFESAAGEAYLRGLESVIHRLKPAQWVCWNMVWEVSAGTTYYNLMDHKRYADPHYEEFGSDFPVVP
jgi:hypothetical protein